LFRVLLPAKRDWAVAYIEEAAGHVRVRKAGNQGRDNLPVAIGGHLAVTGDAAAASALLATRIPG
jgi:hypothetical protein